MTEDSGVLGTAFRKSKGWINGMSPIQPVRKMNDSALPRAYDGMQPRIRFSNITSGLIKLMDLLL
jgi:hypothetical protein